MFKLHKISGSAEIYFYYNDTNQISKIKKVIYRKPLEKLNKEILALNKLKKYKNFPYVIEHNNNNTLYLNYC
jgi:hypothetical protein